MDRGSYMSAYVLNSSQVKIKCEFSKQFPCDCWYVQQNMIIHDILKRPFSEKYKILKKSMIKIFPIEDNAFLKQKTLCGDQDCARDNWNCLDLYSHMF